MDELGALVRNDGAGLWVAVAQSVDCDSGGEVEVGVRLGEEVGAEAVGEEQGGGRVEGQQRGHFCEGWCLDFEKWKI